VTAGKPAGVWWGALVGYTIVTVDLVPINSVSIFIEPQNVEQGMANIEPVLDFAVSC